MTTNYMGNPFGDQKPQQSGLSSFFMGTSPSVEKISTLTPQQQQTAGQLGSGVQQQLPQMFQFLQQLLSQDPQMMQQFQAPAMRQFQEEIIPSIAERFTGQFGEGSERSSGFTQALGQAGAGLAENLAAQRGQLGMQGLSGLQSLLQSSMGPQMNMISQAGQPGFLQSLASTAGSALPAYLLGGPLGALGSGLASLFSGGQRQQSPEIVGGLVGNKLKEWGLM